MMAELAPQSKSGSYERPSYASTGVIGSSQFPDEGGRYQLYLGNPCPWCHRAKLAVALKKLKGENIGVTTLVDDPGKFKVHVCHLFCYPPPTTPVHFSPLFNNSFSVLTHLELFCSESLSWRLDFLK